MSKIVRRYKRSMPLRDLALSLIRGLDGPKNFTGQVRRIQDYVKKNIRYVRDVRGVETVQTPDYTLRQQAGDCDDQSVLVATLLESIGVPTRFMAIKTTEGGPFVHVFAEARIGRRWVPVETTEDWPFGMRPPKMAGVMIKNN